MNQAVMLPLLRRSVLLRTLKQCGAVSPETAKTLKEAGVPSPEAFPHFTDLLVRQGVLHRTPTENITFDPEDNR